MAVSIGYGVSGIIGAYRVLYPVFPYFWGKVSAHFWGPSCYLLLDQVALVVTWRPGMLRPLEENVSGETRIDSIADITSPWNWLP